MDRTKRVVLAGTTEDRETCFYIYYRHNGIVLVQKLNKFPKNAKDVVGYTRVSKQEQADAGDLQRQKESLCRRAACNEENFANWFEEVGSATNGDLPVLTEACGFCRKHGYDLFIKDITRIVRNPDYHPYRNKQEIPTDDTLLRFFKKQKIRVIVTVQETEILSVRVKEGQKESGNYGGGDHSEGYKRRKRESLLPDVINYRRQGLGYGAIAKLVDTSKSNIQVWCKKYVGDMETYD